MEMTVYADLLFAINAAINYLLLCGSAAISGVPARKLRLLGAAALGGLYAVMTVLPGMEAAGGFLCQSLCAALMLLAAFGWKRSTVRQGLFFFALSFVFSGAVLLAVQLIEPNMMLLGGRAYYAVTTPALLLLAGLIYGLAAVVLSGWGTHTGGDLVSLSLSLEHRQLSLKALRDTGNTLRDPISGQSVLVTDWQVLSRLLPDAGIQSSHVRDPAALMQRLSRQYPQLRFRLIPYQAVGVESGLLLALRCCLEEKKGHRQERLVAFSPTPVSEEGRFDALIGGKIA